MRKDIDQLLASMVDPTIFFALTGIDSSKSTDPDSSAPFSDHTLESHVLIVQEIGKRWKSYFQSEVWKLMDPSLLSCWVTPFPLPLFYISRRTSLFWWLPAVPLIKWFTLNVVWTNPLPFWDIPSRDQKLLEELKAAELVIFKVNFSRCYSHPNRKIEQSMRPVSD